VRKKKQRNKQNRKKERREKSEEWKTKGQPVGLPIALALPISSCNFTPKGSFGPRRGGCKKSITCIVTKDYQNEETKPHSKLVFPI